MTQKRDTNIPETCPRIRLLLFSGLRSITRCLHQGWLQIGHNCEGGWYLGMRGRLNKVEAETIHHPCAMCLATCDDAKPPIRLDHTIITPYFDRPPTPSTTNMLPYCDHPFLLSTFQYIVPVPLSAMSVNSSFFILSCARITIDCHSIG